MVYNIDGNTKKKQKQQAYEPGSVPRLPWVSVINLDCASQRSSSNLPPDLGGQPSRCCQLRQYT